MATSPNVANYNYGAGSAYLKVDGIDNDYRHVGNAPSITYESSVEEIEHKQSMHGVKSTDLVIVTELAANINITLEEVTKENMSLFVRGIPETNTSGNTEIGGLTATGFDADFKYVSDNARGIDFEFIARVTVRPNGEFNFITDGLNSIPLTLKVLRDSVTGKFGNWEFFTGETA